MTFGPTGRRIVCSYCDRRLKPYEQCFCVYQPTLKADSSLPPLKVKTRFNYDKVKEATRLLLEGIGDDPNRDGLKDTPDRVAKMYQEIMNGFDEKVEDQITTFDNDTGYSGPVVLKDAAFYTYCEHHLQLFAGKLNIAYQPSGRIVGLSKLVRVARVFAKRPQVQERLTKQIADALQDQIQPKWCVVKIEAEHFCMSIRGARVPGTMTTTIFGHGEWPKDVFKL